MSLSIRLARAGAHKKPFYRVVVADKRMPRDGRFIEKIGTYDPLLKDKQRRVRLSTERAQHWISLGAQPSRRVAIFLADAGVGERPAIPQQTKKSLPRKKEMEKRAALLLKSQQPAAKPPEAAPETTLEAAPETTLEAAPVITLEAAPETTPEASSETSSENKPQENNKEDNKEDSKEDGSESS